MEFEWWQVHIVVVVMLPVNILSFMFEPGSPLSLGIAAVGAFGLILFGPLSLVAYYKDSKMLEERDDNWQPGWISWVVGSFIVTPFVTSTFYLILRYFLVIVPKKPHQNVDRQHA
jgi:hypothetical protein